MPTRKRQRKAAEEQPPSEDEAADENASSNDVSENGENEDEEENEDNEDNEDEEEEQEEYDEDNEENESNEEVEDDDHEEDEEEDNDDEVEENDEDENDQSQDDEEDQDEEEESASQTQSIGLRRSSRRKAAQGSSRRRGNEAASVSSTGPDTPKSSVITSRKSNAASSSRQRRNAHSDDDDDEDKEEDTFQASAAVPGSEHDKRPFKNLDNYLQIPIRVVKQKKGSGTEVIAKKYSIPAPPTTNVAQSFEKVLQGSYHAPVAYIRAKQEMIRPQDYEMTAEDEAWIQQKHPKLNYDTFEKIFTAFETATGTGAYITQGKAFPIVQRIDPNLPKQVSDDIHAYWSVRRARNKRPLLRRFWPVTPAEDQTPTSTFRPREKEKYRLRKKRTNDVESYEKLCMLKRDFDRVKDMLELIKRREELKHLEAELVHYEYLAKINPAMERPACLNAPLPSTLTNPTPMYEKIYSAVQLLSESFNVSRHGGMSGAGQKNRLPYESSGRDADSNKKINKKRTDEEIIPKQPISTAYTPSSAPVPEAKEIKPIIPLPRYLIEPSYVRPTPATLATLYPAVKKRAKALKIEYVPKYGRNRRIVFDRVSVPRGSVLLPNVLASRFAADPFVPTPAVLEKMTKLLIDEADSDDETVETIDHVIYGSNRGVSAVGQPKFQLIISSNNRA